MTSSRVQCQYCFMEKVIGTTLRACGAKQESQKTPRLLRVHSVSDATRDRTLKIER